MALLLVALLGFQPACRYWPAPPPPDETALVPAANWKGPQEGVRWSRPDPVVTGEAHEYPDIVVDGADNIWTTWVAWPDGQERIAVQRRPVASSRPADQLTFGSAAGPTGWPRITARGRDVYLTWAERRSGRFQIKLAWFHEEKLQGIDDVSSPGADALRPAVVVDGQGTPWVAWEERHDQGRQRVFALMARKMSRTGRSAPLPIDETGELNLRPALAAGPGSSVAIAWDHYEAGQYDIRLRVLVPQGPAQPVQITRDRFVDLAPSLMYDAQNRLWLAWESDRPVSGEQPRDGRALIAGVVENGAFRLPVAGLPPTMSALPERSDLDEMLEFPQLARDLAGRIFLFARRGQGFAAMYLEGDHWSRPIDLSEKGWGGRGRELRPSIDRRGVFHLAARWLHRVGHSLLEPPEGKAGPIELQPPTVLARAGQGSGDARPGATKGSSPSASARSASRDAGPQALGRSIGTSMAPVLRPLFGDLHTHTWISDGSGEPDEVFTRARDRLGEDFVALTDHDITNGNRMSPSEWAWEQLLDDFFNVPGKFATLVAYEWTSPPVEKGGFGHRNVYYPGDQGKVFNSDVDALTTATLFELIRSTGAFTVPHHTSWTGTDWGHFDPVLAPLFEIVSLHGNSERSDGAPIHPRHGDAGTFAVNGLERGYHFGFVGGTDGHGFPWHYGVSRQEDVWTTGLTGVLAPVIERSGIIAQLKARHCYATSGPRIHLQLEYQGRQMGDEAPEKVASSPAPATDLVLKVHGTAPLASLELLVDGRLHQRIALEPGSADFDHPVRFLPIQGVHGYYVRVVQADGTMAWSSPIWVRGM